MDNDQRLAFNHRIAAEFRANAGKVGPPFENQDLLLLTTTGARSGQARLSPLTYRRMGDRLLVIGGNGGTDVTPAWVHNLHAEPRAHVELGTESFDVIAHEITGEQRSALIPEIVSATPHFAELEARVTRVIPIFELRRDNAERAHR